MAWSLSGHGEEPRAVDILFCSTSLAGYHPAKPDPLESEQQKGRYLTSTSRTVFEYQTSSSDLSALNYRLLEALSLANRRFNETRPATQDLVFARQKKVVASQTRYFVLRGAKGEASGMGMLVEGNQGVQLPVEIEFPAQNLRQRGGRPRRLVELARLATDEKEKGGLLPLFESMAIRLKAEYGEPPPEDLDVILWTSLTGLTSVYQNKYGFEVWRNPNELGCAECSVLGLSARDFVKKYAP